MNVDIANILKGKIDALNFVDRIAGMVRPVIKIDTAQDDENQDYLVRKVFPVACNVSLAECEEQEKYLDLVPNSKFRSLLYFEDRGVTFVGREGGLHNYRSRTRLVGWLNMEKIQTSGCSVSAIIIAVIIKQFPLAKFNSGNYQRINISAISEAPKSAEIFGAYSYSEETNQYLLYPYDYFALDIETDFAMSDKCVDENSITLIDPSCP